MLKKETGVWEGNKGGTMHKVYIPLYLYWHILLFSLLK